MGAEVPTVLSVPEFERNRVGWLHTNCLPARPGVQGDEFDSTGNLDFSWLSLFGFGQVQFQHALIHLGANSGCVHVGTEFEHASKIGLRSFTVTEVAFWDIRFAPTDDSQLAAFDSDFET